MEWEQAAISTKTKLVLTPFSRYILNQLRKKCSHQVRVDIYLFLQILRHLYQKHHKVFLCLRLNEYNLEDSRMRVSRVYRNFSQYYQHKKTFWVLRYRETLK
jgi:hypothetical protein